MFQHHAGGSAVARATWQQRYTVVAMGITRRATEPQGVTNASGQPEIVLEIEGLTLSMSPPARAGTPEAPAIAPHDADADD